MAGSDTGQFHFGIIPEIGEGMDSTMGRHTHPFAMVAGGQSKDTITHRLEMLVRAYDPCISCSTHVIDLR